MIEVLIVRELAQPGHEDLKFIMITQDTVSPVMVLKRKSSVAGLDPNNLYGDACAIFTGKDKADISITVATCTIGNLKGRENL